MLHCSTTEEGLVSHDFEYRVIFYNVKRYESLGQNISFDDKHVHSRPGETYRNTLTLESKDHVFTTMTGDNDNTRNLSGNKDCDLRVQKMIVGTLYRPITKRTLIPL